jgi:sodium/proline symporter
VVNNSITIPDYISNRFHEKKKVLMTIASLFILVFFTVYASSCFVTCGKLFSTLFGASYTSMLIVGAVFVLIYTFLGGFLAESASDFMQAIVMIIALVVILVCGVSAAGGVSEVYANIQNFPGFLNFFGLAQPQTVDGVQQVANGVPLFGEAAGYGALTVVSTMAWGLGYFGMPQVLLRFMAIRHDSELKKSRRIATSWCVISLGAATCIGLIGRALYPTALETASAAERVFITLSTNLLPPLLAGFIMAGILAATISSSDSYLLIAASSVSKNIYKGILKKDATDKQVLLLARITLLVIAAVGILIALDENSIIFKVVSFAWAGFGATFGPIMLFSLFWKRVNRAGALAGMVSGGVMVFVWKLLIRPLGGVVCIYELLPAIVLSCIFIVVVSLLTAPPSQELCDEFEAAKKPV